MSRYLQAEADLLTRLTTKLTAAGVDANILAMPETDRGFEVSIKKPRITVVFLGAEAGNVQGINGAGFAQDETFSFEIQIKSVNLRGANGIYSLLEIVRVAVMGYRLPNSHTGLTLKNVMLTERDAGIWAYSIFFDAGFIAASEPDASTDVLISQITTLLETAGALMDTIVVPPPA